MEIRNSTLSLIAFTAMVLASATISRAEKPGESENPPESAASRIAALMLDKKKVSAMIGRVVELGMKIPAARELNGTQKKEIVAKMEAIRFNLIEMLPWEKVRGAMAAEYARQFTEDELREILAFYEKGAGRKMLEKQPDLIVGMAERMTRLMDEGQMALAAARNLTQLELKLEGKERKAFLKAKKAKPFPQELLLGRWYGIDETDPGMKSYWWHEKKADGTHELGGLDLDAAEKTYSEYVDPGHYAVIGRLLIETTLETPEFSNYFILQSIDEEKMTYLVVDEDSSLDDWLVTIDQRKKIKPPEIPDDYKKEDFGEEEE